MAFMQVFNPARKSHFGTEHYHYLDGNWYQKSWKQGFFTIYGKKEFKTPHNALYNLLRDPFIEALIEIHKHGETYSNVGIMDHANLPATLSILAAILSSKINSLCDKLRPDLWVLKGILRVAQGMFNFLLRLPITILAVACTYLWDAVKAVTAVIAVTASSLIWAPVVYHRSKDSLDQGELHRPLLTTPN